MAMDYTVITCSQAAAYAKMLSGLTLEEISERTGWGMSQVKRFFNPHEAYCMGASQVPTACNALGNTVLLDWQRANVDAVASPAPAPLAEGDLLARISKITAEHGEVCQSAVEAMADGVLKVHEARRLCHELLDVEDAARRLRNALGEYIHSKNGGKP